MALDATTLRLHAALYRHFYGALRAYEDWIKANQPPVQINPDPVEYFKQQDYPQHKRNK